jgi:hypothetical protein
MEEIIFEKLKSIQQVSSPPSVANNKTASCCTSTPPYGFMTWSLIKHRYNFTFDLQPAYIT